MATAPARSGDPFQSGYLRLKSVPYPHIRELQITAKEEVSLTEHSSIELLLEQAKQSALRVNTDVAFNRPDRAYIEWLRCQEFLVLVTRNAEFPFIKGERRDRYLSIRKEHEVQRDMVLRIQELIEDNNAQTGIQAGQPVAGLTSSSGNGTSSTGGFARPLQLQEKPCTQLDAGQGRRERPVSMAIKQQYNDKLYSNGVHDVFAPSGTSDAPKAVAGADPLLTRFSQLRTTPSSPSARSGHLANGSGLNRRGSQQYIERQNYTSVTVSQMPPAPHPIGEKPAEARVRPTSANQPPMPLKVPLRSQFDTILPRAPSPIYNPARNIQTPSDITPPRSSARSISGNARSSLDRPRFPELKNPCEITAEELYDRVRSFNVLLIDVRPRDQFDEGHILAKSIICIEPLNLRHGIALEELEEKLLYSPEQETRLFERINENDLIVYYDQSTKTSRFLQGSPKTPTAPALRALNDTLTEFNYSRSLQRPPAVLLGGLDAWIDLVGQQALQSSNTATPQVLQRTKPPKRQLQRASLISGNSSRDVRARRLRDYDPMNADEEREWREKAKNEGVEPANFRDMHQEGDNDPVLSQGDELFLPIQTYDEFFRRFPEAPDIRQSMVSPTYQQPPSRPAPVPPIPSVPSRPAPTVSRPSYSGVSERDALQLSPTARQPSSTQPPLYTSRSVAHSLKLPRTGLKNFGVTCYMNATIQCLLGTMPLSRFLLDETWRSFVQKNWKGSNGIMPEIFANLIRSLWRNDAAAVRPISFRKFCTRLNPEWGIDRQQDAKEFLEFLVDCLHEDFNSNWNRTPLRPLTTQEEFSRESMPINIVSKKEWERYSHREHSYIADLFAGQHASRLRCTTCHNTSTTYEAFYSISVEIPRSGAGDIRDCLRSYCQEERLSGDEEWKCPRCQCQREATKQIIITRLPNILVIHFKRFSASKTESARKVHTPIEFPLHGLNMQPYMADTRMSPARPEEYPDPAITPPFMYDAYGVMRHIGQTGNGGHYISLVRDAARGIWRRYDDQNVSDFDPGKLRSDQRLQNEQAYIVFYERARAR